MQADIDAANRMHSRHPPGEGAYIFAPSYHIVRTICPPRSWADRERSAQIPLRGCRRACLRTRLHSMQADIGAANQMHLRHLPGEGAHSFAPSYHFARTTTKLRIQDRQRDTDSSASTLNRLLMCDGGGLRRHLSQAYVEVLVGAVPSSSHDVLRTLFFSLYLPLLFLLSRSLSLSDCFEAQELRGGLVAAMVPQLVVAAAAVEAAAAAGTTTTMPMRSLRIVKKKE